MLVHRPELPPELDTLVLKLMAKSPADRYQSAGEMLADLTKLRDVASGRFGTDDHGYRPSERRGHGRSIARHERGQLRAARPQRRPPRA